MDFINTAVIVGFIICGVYGCICYALGCKNEDPDLKTEGCLQVLFIEFAGAMYIIFVAFDVKLGLICLLIPLYCMICMIFKDVIPALRKCFLHRSHKEKENLAGLELKKSPVLNSEELHITYPELDMLMEELNAGKRQGKQLDSISWESFENMYEPEIKALLSSKLSIEQQDRLKKILKKLINAMKEKNDEENIKNDVTLDTLDNLLEMSRCVIQIHHQKVNDS